MDSTDSELDKLIDKWFISDILLFQVYNQRHIFLSLIINATDLWLLQICPAFIHIVSIKPKVSFFKLCSRDSDL